MSLSFENDSRFETRKNQSTVSTAKRLACLDNNIINGYESACTCIWNSKYNVHVCMIQTNADFIFQKLIVFVSNSLKRGHRAGNF